MPFGPEQINKPTPLWAKYTFRIIYLTTSAALLWMAGTNMFSQNLKYETMLALKIVLDPLLYGISKMFGVAESDVK